jgi:hypothetical protein
MKEKKLSGIAKEMTQQILCRKVSSLEAIGVAIKIVHIAWNLAYEEYPAGRLFRCPDERRLAGVPVAGAAGALARTSSARRRAWPTA